MKFVHLHLHSEFSLIDGLVRVKPLIAQTFKEGMPAVAITDQGNLFAMVKFYRAALAKGIKPIIGSEIYLDNPDDIHKPYSLLLFCQNHTGYNNLSILLSKAYKEGQQTEKPTVQHEWLQQHAEGLIALSGATRGEIGEALLAGNKDAALEKLNYYRQLFPERFYLELQRTGRPREEEHVQAALDLAEEAQTPVVATNDVRFLSGDDFEAHEARVCIHSGRVLHDSKRPRDYSEQQYFRSTEEMIELFEDVPEAIENTIEIAKRCNLTLTLGKNYLPDFPVPEGMTVEEFLAESSRKGLERRFAENASLREKDKAPYDERLQVELDVINQMGFPGYFLIVADFIQWSKNNGVPVGPGRGSGAGSLVAYALYITDLDPLEYELLFERFLNPERVSMPDFDVDFCMDGRDRVIDYVAQKYGRESVSQIITYGTMAAKAVIRDVGRVLDFPYGFVDKIAKLVPFEIGMTLDKALEEPAFEERYNNEEDVRVLVDLAKKLEGVARNAGKHAGGVVISPGKLTDFTPIYCEAGSQNNVTQFDKDDVEAVGLVKFDFLGLRTLTIIDWAVQAINQRADRKDDPLDISQISTTDETTFDLLKACQTTAVFQLESRGMKELIKRLEPDCFEEIIALVALFRPGPLQSGMVDDFIDRKHGRAKVVYPHPKLEPILEPTYGVILYQEQVMQIAQVLALYSLGGADILRRAMGKKKPEEMAKQRKIFTEGALKNGVEEKTATYIFDLMEKFAGYGFNKSHSAAYALVAYQTAWLKAHYPAEFMAAVLSSDMDNTDKVVIFIEECEAMKINIHPPAINEGEIKFSANEQGEIIYGLGAIKGVGEAALVSVVAERKENGPYKSLFDFCKRNDSRKVTKRVLEALIKAGAMDELGPHRATMMASIASVQQAAEQFAQNKARNQNDLFAMGGDEDDGASLEPPFKEIPRWPDKTTLQFEYDTLGFYLSGHPFDAYAQEARNFTCCNLRNLPSKMDSAVTIAGLVVGIRKIKTQRGKLIVIVTLDDGTSKADVTVFSEVFEKSEHALEKGNLVVIEGDASHDSFNDGVKVLAKRVWAAEEARHQFARRIRLELKSDEFQKTTVGQLAQLLGSFQGGGCPVHLIYKNEVGKALIPLGKKWEVAPRETLLQSLKKLFPEGDIKIDY